MALTNFAALTTEQKTAWSMDLWRQARNMSFIGKFMGKGSNSMVQRITELKKSEKGARAVITLLAELEGDGIAGDTTLEGNEEAMKSYDQVIRIDQLRHANRSQGRIADQKSIVGFRENSRDVLAYWLADRLDQMAFLTLSGVSYATKNNGAARTASNLQNLEFNADVVAASTNRYYNWDDSASALIAGNTATVAADDKPSYEMLVRLKAQAKDSYIRGIKSSGGEEQFHVFMTPKGMASLKLDSDYLTNVRNAMPRSKGNELFSGTTSVHVDGMWVHEYRHVFNTDGLTTSVDKWGSGNTIDGQAVLFCGAQALGFADIGTPEWVEKDFDYDNQQGISVGKIMGMLKPQFNSQVTDTTEDFGVIRINTAV